MHEGRNVGQSHPCSSSAERAFEHWGLPVDNTTIGANQSRRKIHAAATLGPKWNIFGWFSNKQGHQEPGSQPIASSLTENTRQCNWKMKNWKYDDAKWRPIFKTSCSSESHVCRLERMDWANASLGYFVRSGIDKIQTICKRRIRGFGSSTKMADILICFFCNILSPSSENHLRSGTPFNWIVLDELGRNFAVQTVQCAETRNRKLFERT